MLSGVASLLFGNAAGEVTVDQTQESQNVDLDIQDAELGWVLVDVPASGSMAQLEENPLENLLIEHPSMSVYHVHHGAESANEQENIIAVLPPTGHQRQHGVQQAQRQAHTLATRSGADQVKLSRSHQRQQCAALGKNFTRKCTEHSNKTRMQNSCRKQGSVHNRALRPSGFMSGRRGQRTQ